MAIYNREDPRTALPQLEKLLHGEIEKLSTDYVVEQGKRGDWVYRKWNSGFVECYGELTASSISWIAYLSWGYYANWTVPYPFNIYDPKITANIRYTGGSNVGWVANVNPYSDAAFTATIVRNGNTGQPTIYTNIVGRWK